MDDLFLTEVPIDKAWSVSVIAALWFGVHHRVQFLLSGHAGFEFHAFQELSGLQFSGNQMLLMNLLFLDLIVLLFGLVLDQSLSLLLLHFFLHYLLLT